MRLQNRTVFYIQKCCATSLSSVRLSSSSNWSSIYANLIQTTDSALPHQGQDLPLRILGRLMVMRLSQSHLKHLNLHYTETDIKAWDTSLGTRLSSNELKDILKRELIIENPTLFQIPCG